MSEPSRPDSILPSEQERIRQKTFHPTGTFTEFTEDEVEQSVPARFEKIVRRYPDRIALKTADGTLPYSRLNTISDGIARAIVAAYGSESQPVALLFEKGPQLVAAILAVLKAGKFFVPLDPAFPKARIRTILEDSQARFVVTNRRHLASARELAHDRDVMEFESVEDKVRTNALTFPVSPSSPALIFYTSGSTGGPKGVVWNHRHLLHSTKVRTNTYHICPHDKLSLLPAGTPNAATNALAALLNGATLFPFDVQGEGVRGLADWLSRERISICLISSPLFRSLCEVLTGRETFPDLRLIRLTSESVYKLDVDLYRRHFSAGCILVNGLSSSETGPITKYFIDHQIEITDNQVPVGYAVDGKDISLVDSTGNDIGFNQVGEITVRSRYVARGYWHRPALTDAKFKAGPDDQGRIHYLTGDLGMMLPDGCLIHKGRKDFRVKIRGYGVEVGEVEKTLLEHPAVRQSLVTASQNESGEARLIAYFTSNALPSTTSDLRGFLREKLPEYMVPSSFVRLDSLPLTRSGKVDRMALPVPTGDRPSLEIPFVAPRTPVEEALTRIWTEVLKVDPIGVHDKFLDLGGHSLMATQIISRVIDRFRLELPIKSLLDTPTVAQMAVVITQTQAVRAGDEELDRVLSQLEALSDEETQRLASNQVK